MAFVKRFVRHCRDKVLTKRVSKTRLIQLKNKKHLKTFIENEIELPSEQEKRSAMQFFISHEQAISYPKEIAYCKEKMRESEEIDETPKHKNFPEHSKIVALHPFMDSAGVLRVGGRIGNSKELPYDTKRPIIIPPGSRICELIIADAHMSTYHGAIQVMMQYIRAIY